MPILYRLVLHYWDMVCTVFQKIPGRPAYKFELLEIYRECRGCQKRKWAVKGV